MINYQNILANFNFSGLRNPKLVPTRAINSLMKLKNSCMRYFNYYLLFYKYFFFLRLIFVFKSISFLLFKFFVVWSFIYTLVYHTFLYFFATLFEIKANCWRSRILMFFFSILLVFHTLYAWQQCIIV